MEAKMDIFAGYESRRVLSRHAETIAFNALALAALSIATSAYAADYYGYGAPRYGATTYAPQPRYTEYYAPVDSAPVYRRVLREYRVVVVTDPPSGSSYIPPTSYPTAGYGAAPYPQYGATAYPQYGYGATPFPQYGATPYPQYGYGTTQYPPVYGQAYRQAVDPGYRVVQTPRTYARPIARERIITQYRDLPYEPFGAIEPGLNYPPVTYTEVVDVDEYGAAVPSRPAVRQVYRNDAGIYGRYGIYEGRAVDPGELIPTSRLIAPPRW
jgi:hypothetical protein